MAFTAAAVLAGDRNALAFGSGRRSGAHAVRSAADAHRLGLRLLPPGHACPRSAQRRTVETVGFLSPRRVLAVECCNYRRIRRTCCWMKLQKGPWRNLSHPGGRGVQPRRQGPRTAHPVPVRGLRCAAFHRAAVFKSSRRDPPSAKGP